MDSVIKKLDFVLLHLFVMAKAAIGYVKSYVELDPGPLKCIDYGVIFAEIGIGLQAGVIAKFVICVGLLEEIDFVWWEMKLPRYCVIVDGIGGGCR